MVSALVQIPAISRARLEALARADRKSVRSKLAELIDHAFSAAEVAEVSNEVHVQSHGNGYGVDLFDGEFRVALTQKGIASLAADMLTVADQGGSAINREYAYVVRRSRRCIVVEINAHSRSTEPSDGKRTTLVKLLMPNVARQIAIDLLEQT